MALTGIDVSHFQGSIDWPAVAASGTYFCFIKATEGAGHVDPQFIKNWQGSRSAGVLRGAYHFFQPSIPVASQAESFLKTIGPMQSGDLPPVLDLEAPSAWADIAPADRSPRAVQWLETVERSLGVTPIVYLSPAFATEVLKNAPTLGRFPLWLAHYTDSETPNLAAPWLTWTFWQYSGSGKAAGVKRPVDLDRFNGLLDDLKALAIPA